MSSTKNCAWIKMMSSQPCLLCFVALMMLRVARVASRPGTGMPTTWVLTRRASSEDSSESSDKPWASCSNGAQGEWRERDDTGCINPDDSFYAKASEDDVIGGARHTGSWDSCKALCSAAAKGYISPDDLECGRGYYVTFDKENGACYFYRPTSAPSSGCEQWRSKDSDRLGMYCGAEQDSESDSSDSSDSEDDSSEDSSDSPDKPWASCSNGAGGEWRERDDTGCINPDDGFYAKASEDDVIGGVRHTGSWDSCKALCSAAAKGHISPDELECGRGYYVTLDKENGACYFYRPTSALSSGCEQWRSKDSDRLGMYCGPERAQNYERTYSGWVGEYCSGQETIRNIRCPEGGSDEDCRKLCAAECDKERDCLAFMTDYDWDCSLYSKCDVVGIDGCDDCTVQICLENCPGHAKPYYLREDSWQVCNPDNVIQTFAAGGSGWMDLVDDCAGICAASEDCNEFRLPAGRSVCELYSWCDLDYHDEDDEGGIVGSFREISNGIDPAGTLPEPWDGGCIAGEPWWREVEGAGCYNPGRSFKGSYKRVMDGDGDYTGTLEGCRRMCSSAALGRPSFHELVQCKRGYYVTFNEDTGDCYFHRNPSAPYRGCKQWRRNKYEKVAMYCGPEQ